MRHAVPTSLAVIVLLLSCSSSIPAQQLKSGPQSGDFIPGPFHPLNLNGEYATDPHCLVCQYGLSPVVLVFTRDLAKTVDLLQKLDAAVANNREAGLRSFVVVLSEGYAKPDTRSDAIQAMEKTASELKNLAVAVEGPAGPVGYNLAKEADVTVILYHRLRVVANFTFEKDKLSEKETTDILAAVQKMASGK